jgi:hypothetical protein
MGSCRGWGESKFQVVYPRKIVGLAQKSPVHQFGNPIAGKAILLFKKMGDHVMMSPQIVRVFFSVFGRDILSGRVFPAP